jgi:hypothetical protein
MRTYIKFIGLFDKQSRVHGVKLEKGLNLITGKSSTGKRRLSEIRLIKHGSSEELLFSLILSGTEVSSVSTVTAQWRNSSSMQYGLTSLRRK